MTEIWKSVVGYEGFYEVSNLGNVKSLARMDAGNRNWLTEKLIQGEVNHKGYVRAPLTKDRKTVKHLVHRLVLLAFIGACPDGMEGCHNNGDSLDNRLGNLRWDTPKSNWEDRFLHKTATIGEAHPAATISETTAAVIKLDLQAGHSPEVIARWNCVTRNVVYNIKYGRTWRHAA